MKSAMAMTPMLFPRNKTKKFLIPLLAVSVCAVLYANGGRSQAAETAKTQHAGLLNLSDEEQAHLQRIKAVSMCIDPDWMPYERINEQGLHEGMSADYMALFEQRIGIPIRLVPTASWSETLSFGRERRCDILSLLNESPERSKFLNFTSPYVEAPIVLVTRDDVTFLEGISDLGDRSISTPKGYIYEERIKNDYPEINLVTVPTATDGLTRVSKGEIFTHLGSLFVVVNQMQERQLSNLKITGHTEYVHKLAIGVRNDDPVLLAILDKAVRSISQAEHIEIRRKWTATKIEHGVDYALLWSIIIGGLALLMIVLVWNRKLSHLNARVRESEAEYRAIFAASKVGLAMCKMDGTLVDCNQAYLDIIGYTEKEAHALTYWDVTPRSFEKDESKQLRSLEKTGGYGPYEKYYIRKNGDQIPVLLNGTLLKGADGNDYIWSIVQDITDRKNIEERLRFASEAAEAANKAKSEFLSSMSHELRTPLNAVLGFGQILNLGGDKLTENQTAAVQQILKGGEHLLGLINEVLDLARIESGRVKFSITPVEPSDAIRQCLLMTKSMAVKYDVEVQPFTLAGDLPTINVDAIRFEQILLNLMSNAVKYNRPKGSVTLTCEETADGMLRINVTDTGDGIPPDMLDDLFTPFKRLGRESGNIEGTGIGLNITKDLVELMEGRIDFESQVGKGCTFWVEFPIAKTQPPGARSMTESTGKQAGHPVTTPKADTKRLVLYVEDNPDNVVLMKEIAAIMGNLDLRIAQDAELGIAMAQGDPPDLILMDIHLPGMSGVEALRVLKEGGETAHIPVLAISAEAMPSSIKEAMDEGFEGYITKPINLPEVISIISKILNR